jgi:hypothetical protein
MEPDEAAREMVRGGTVADLEPLDVFLVNLSRPAVGGLLPPPPPPAKQSKGEEIDGGKRSVRLAAKPTAGLSIMEKVSIVLLKKSGVVAEDAVPQAADLQKYRSCYKKPLPAHFIEDVTSLVQDGDGAKEKMVDSGLTAV